MRPRAARGWRVCYDPGSLVGIRVGVAGGRDGSPQTAEPAGMDAQGVANVVEPDGVGELGEEQAHDMTPRCEGACLFVDAMPACELGHEVGGNEFAKLGEDGPLGLGWLVFHQADPEWDRPPAILLFVWDLEFYGRFVES
jgi:hypothetical protein